MLTALQSKVRTEVCFLQGGFEGVSETYPKLCYNSGNNKMMTLETNSGHTTPIYKQDGPVELLPFLFLGSMVHSSCREALAAVGITIVLNVSLSCPNLYEGEPLYLRLTVEDSVAANMRVCFSTAITFIGGSANRLIRRAGSVVGMSLESVEVVVELRMLSKLRAVLENSGHPLHSVFSDQKSSVSNRLLSLPCSTERFRRSFVPSAIRLSEADGCELLHCKAGILRSATICLAYLMHTHRVRLQEAFNLKQQRNIISANVAFMGQLLQFETDVLCQG